VVVDQHGKTFTQAIPDLPDEWALMEQLTVLREEAVAQPDLQGFASKAYIREQGSEDICAPFRAVCLGK